MSANHRSNPPAEFQELLALWQGLRGVFQDDQLGVEQIDQQLATGAWAWDLVLEHKAPSEVDRMGEVMLGPVYTCDSHPWPENDGVPMTPLVQLDLDRASALAGISMGKGLLQAFVAADDRLGQSVHVRTIDRVDVDRERLQPLPKFNTNLNGFASIEWADPGTAVPSCIQVAGIEGPRFTCCNISELRELFDLKALDAVPKAKAERFQELVRQQRDRWSPGGFHLFGTFYPIQYSQADRDWPLLCLESEHGFNFGEGQGQLFFSPKNSGETTFYFDWSCY